MKFDRPLQPSRAPFALALFPTLGLLAALAWPGAAVAQRTSAALQHAPLSPVAGEVIVGFKADAPSLRRQALAASGATQDEAARVRGILEDRASSLGQRRGLRLQAGAGVSDRAQVMRMDGMDAAALVRALASDPEVAFVVPNGRQRALTAPNDPLYPLVARGQRPNGPDSGQWYLRAPTADVASSINIESAWARTQGSPNLVVAVLDTGVRFDHPDLGRSANGGPLLPGYDFVADAAVGNDSNGRDADPSDPGDWVTSAESNTTTFRDCSVSDSSWHGTKTASLVAAATNNNLGMAGTAPGLRVLPVRVLGKCFGTDSDIQAGMLWAGGIAVPGVPVNPNPAKVLNMSLGGSGECTAGYQSAVDRLLERGVIVVAAAGNSAGGPVSVPANCRGVVSVLALRHVGTKVGFSDLGPEITLAAPGGNCINISAGSPCLYPILAATNRGTRLPTTSGWTDSFDATVGTSFSSPLVAGVVGLMLSAQPSMTPQQVRSVLQSTARPFPTTGGDNGPEDPAPVAQCQAPANGITQLQCYCTTALCGAGMLDAGAAVAAASGPMAQLQLTSGTPVASSTISLTAAGSSGSIVGYSWSLISSGGIVNGFDSSTNAVSASLTPTAAGSFTVQLQVTDNLGASSTTSLIVTVAAAPGANPTPPAPVPPPAEGSGGGGGAMSWLWVLGVGLAAAVLWRRPRDGSFS